MQIKTFTVLTELVKWVGSYALPTIFSMAKVRIIKARREHIQIVVDMWKDFIDFHGEIEPFYKRRARAHLSYKKHLMNTIDSRNSQIFVALDRNRIIGYTYVIIAKYPPVWTQKRYGYICDMYTKPSHRREGVGRLMLDTAKEWFRKKGMKHIELNVIIKNRTALSFWRKMGFDERMARMHMEI